MSKAHGDSITFTPAEVADYFRARVPDLRQTSGGVARRMPRAQGQGSEFLRWRRQLDCPGAFPRATEAGT